MSTKLHRFDDGDETIMVRTTMQPTGEYTAVNDDTYDCDCDENGFFSKSPVGYGFSELSAIADLFEQLPRAESERQDRQAAQWDHARDLRKHG